MARKCPRGGAGLMWNGRMRGPRMATSRLVKRSSVRSLERTGSYADQHRFDHCLHGKDGTGSGITGPIVEIDTVGDAGQPYGTGYKNEDFFWFYDPATFVPVAGGKIWDVEPTDWAYALDLAPNYAVLKDNSAAGGGAGNCISADEGSRLILIPTGYSIPGNPSGVYVNVFAVAP